MREFRIGVDSYCYHRLLGEIRPGERDPLLRLPDGGLSVVRHVQRLSVDAISLQTAFLPPDRAALEEIAAVAEPMELTLAWGAPNGIEFGRSTQAVAQLFHWIDLAGNVGCRMMRIVAGGPALRANAHEWPNAIAPLREAAMRAEDLQVALALENHGDLTAVQIACLLAEVDHPNLRICFDSANAVRVGEDVLEAAALLAPAVGMIHLKDVEALETETSAAAGPCSVPYGEGVIPLEELLATFIRFGALPTVHVELGQLGANTDESELVAECVAWLKKVRTSTLATGSRQ
jgi:sugar phosphate isomerase/epimerase